MPARTTSILSLSSVLAAGAALSACDRADPAARPLADSSGALQHLSGGSYNAPKEKHQSDIYRGVLATAKPVMDANSSSAQGAAAAGMVGSAQLGQAQPYLLAAADADLSALARASLIRTLVDNYTSQSLTAETSAGFDPAPLIADLDNSRAEAERDIAQNQAKLADTERRIADLSAKADAKAAESKQLNDEFLAVRASLATLSASEAESRLIAARETKRRGDGFRVEASRLQAQADMLKPEARELKVLVDASKNRIASIGRMKLEASEKAQQGQAAAAQSRSAANESAKQIEEKLKELAAVRNNESLSSFDAGIAALRNALTTARTASGDSASSAGKLLTARAQLALANALSSKASSLYQHSLLLSYVINAKPTLPFAAATQTELTQLLELHTNTLEDASTAFEAAQSAFAGIQLRGSGTTEIKDRLTQLADRLGTLAGKPPEPTDTPSDAAPVETAPTASNDAATGWVDLYAALDSGDADALLSHTKIADPAHEAIVRAIADLTAAQKPLDAACTEKFGQSFQDAQAAALGLTVPKNASDFTVTPEGDTAATVTHPASPSPTKIILDNGKWMIDSSSLATGPVAMMAPMVEPLKKAMAAITADIQDGKITKIEDVAAELQKRLMSGGG